jgi:hypothetical protein
VSPKRPVPAPALVNLQTPFISIRPRIQKHGEVYFRHVRCPHQKEDLISEMTALSWRWVIRLTDKGRDPTAFVSAIATFAARAVRSGRRRCRMERPNDVLSPRAQRERGICVSKLPDFSTLGSNPLEEALTDNTQSPPDEQAAFRIGFPAWLATLDDRRRRIAEDLMMGERTLDVANRHGISPARISQLRREFMADWERFHGM